MAAHFKASAKNSNNGSKISFQLALGGSNNLISSICAGLLSTGYRHAPIMQARDFIFHSNEKAEHGIIYPGFGHSIYKDCIDPSFNTVVEEIRKNYPSVWESVERRNSELNEINGITIFPNAAAITAAAAEIFEIPPPLEIMLFITPRVTEWIFSMLLNNTKVQPREAGE